MTKLDITTAEWQVMKVLWDENPISSRQIIDTLAEEKDWKPTTSKTLLSRLVQKDIVGYTEEKRYRSYFPLYTEMECLQYEMQQLIYKIYGDVIHHETSYFRFFGDNDQTYIATLSEDLDRTYESFSKILDYRLPLKQSIHLHSSIQRIHSALGNFNAPSWLRAGWQWQILHIAPQSEFNNDEAKKMLHHVLLQLMLFKINFSIPEWVGQGISAYLSKWLQKERLEKTMKIVYPTLTMEVLTGITTDYLQFPDVYMYELGYTLFECIVDRYGEGVLSKIARNPYSLYEILQTDKESLLALWKTSIKHKYNV